MNGPIIRWAINLVIGYLLTQLARWKDLFDWAKFRQEADDYIRAKIPGEFLDQMFVDIANTVIDACAKVLGDKAHLDVILKALAAGDFATALVALRQMLEAIWKPGALAVDAVWTPVRHVANDLEAGHQDLVGTRPDYCVGEGCHESFALVPAAPAEPPAPKKGKKGEG